MVLIWGSTPLAVYLAAQLEGATWLTDEITAEAVREAGGIALENRKTMPASIVTEMKAAKKPDLIILATPAWYTATAANILAGFVPMNASPPPILCLQNGVGNLERFDSLFGKGHTIAGVITQAIHFLTRPDGSNELLRNSLRVEKRGGIALQHDHPRSMEIANLLRGAGFQVNLDHAEAILWSSVWWGLQANAISSILNIEAAEVYRQPELFDWEYAQLVEALVILRRAEIRLAPLPDVSVPRMITELSWLPKSVLRRVLGRYPRPHSFKEDLQLKMGRSEAAYFNGAIAILADKMKLQAPLNHALALTLTDIAEGRALWSQYDLKRLGATLRLARG